MSGYGYWSQRLGHTSEETPGAVAKRLREKEMRARKEGDFDGADFSRQYADALESPEGFHSLVCVLPRSETYP